MTENETFWLAGLLEGEGYFGRRHTAELILQMTDEDVVRRAHTILGSGSVHRRDVPGRKPLWRLCSYGAPAEASMRALAPHMGARRQAMILDVLTRPNKHHPHLERHRK